MYIQEAHPSDAWQMASNVRDHVVFTTPKSDGERTNVAGACVRRLGIRIPALVDGIDNHVEGLYTGWPDRLYLVDRGGRVAYKTAPGPYGFSTKGLEDALAQATLHTSRTDSAPGRDRPSL